MTPFGVPAHRESEAPFVYKFCRFTVTGLTMARFLCPFLAFASLLPLRLSFQQFLFRYAEHLTDGIVKLFSLWAPKRQRIGTSPLPQGRHSSWHSPQNLHFAFTIDQ